MFKNPFSFNGRIKRTEYGISFVIYLSLYLFVRIMIDKGGSDAAFAILFIPIFWFSWAQSAKRCHDLNKSGWWQLIPFIFSCFCFQKAISGPTNMIYRVARCFTVPMIMRGRLTSMNRLQLL